RVQLVGHKYPRSLGIGLDGCSNVLDEVFFGTRFAQGRGDDLAGRHFEVRDQALRSMPDVLELAPLRESGARRSGRMLSLKRLHPCLLIGADHVNSLFMQLG